MEIEDEVNLLMSTDILAAQISTKKISFTRAQSGWIFREDRKVSNCVLYLDLLHKKFCIYIYIILKNQIICL